MRILDATISATYSGRLDTELPTGRRAVILKADDSVQIVDEACGVKPRNWMTAPRTISTPALDSGALPVTWHFASIGDREVLSIHFEEVHADVTMPLDLSAPGLEKNGTELDLQSHLMHNHDEIEPGLIFIEREFQTSAGPVDLLFEDEHGVLVVVEVKRKTTLNSVDQLDRYVVAARESTGRDVRGILAGLDVRPRTRTACEKRGLAWAEVR